MSVPSRQYIPIDGAQSLATHTRKASRSPPLEDICCIYVHAGAGYHSHQNERIHLEACNDAAQLAMLVLRNGGTALDAVEMAIKTLEDREITNAGYGSNLAMDGIVECDASIVDHYGRSGAVGAVSQIKNPISLARLVLGHTMKPLTLRRVPPNLLVAQGATEFAAEMGMPILPHDALVSPAAHERWVRWRADLKSAERKARKAGSHPACWKIRDDITPEIEKQEQRAREQHTLNLLQACPSLQRSPLSETSEVVLSEAGPDPHLASLQGSEHSSDFLYDVSASTPNTSAHSAMHAVERFAVTDSSRNVFINSTQKVPTLSQMRSLQSPWEGASENIPVDVQFTDSNESLVQHTTARTSWADGSEDSELPSSVKTAKPALPQHKTEEHLTASPSSIGQPQVDREDHITDTVGAIAVDSWGNIACGASSGGIGMKYRGRVGPAALVGVGTSVIPVAPDDPEQACVATVASGTGEHMGTTMAATVCAERLYQSVKKNKGGEYEEVNEDEALKAMIENEFMGHPSVKCSNSVGAIGILGIKKVRTGLLLYFGHNTDSFAMASMTSDEDVPVCTMSRSKSSGQIAQGGRMLPARRFKKTKSMARH